MSTEDQSPTTTQEPVDASELGVIYRENLALRDSIRQERARTIRAWGAVCILGVALGGLCWIWLTSFPKLRYIETRDNSPICAMNAADSPYLTPSSLANFAMEAALDSYTYDYLNFEKQVTGAANRWFTEEGRKSFLKSLDDSGNLESVIKYRLSLKTRASQTAQLEEQGMLDPQTNYWVVRVPIVIEFYAGGLEQPRSKTNYLAVVTLVSVRPSAERVKGIAVDSLVLKPYTPTRK